MMRKMIVIASAIAMTVSVVAVTAVVGATSAGAADPPVTCSATTVVTFAPPGISVAGSVSALKTSVTTTSGTTFGGGCTGSSPGNTITTKNIKCDKHTAGLPASNPACVPGMLGYGSVANFSAMGVSGIQKSLKKLNFSINGIPYQTKTTGASIISCAGPEVGFQIVGTVKAPKADKGQTSTFNACLGSDTGPGTTGSFLADFGSPTATIATTTVDPVTSTVHIG